jgi:hypothetical protein
MKKLLKIQVAPPKPPPLSVRELKEAFEREYIMTDSFDMLKEKINSVSKAVNEYYPCFAVFQASGYGKSRLVSENAKKHHLTLSWCLRPQVSGYPLRSSTIADQIGDLLKVSH